VRRDLPVAGGQELQSVLTGVPVEKLVCWQIKLNKEILPPDEVYSLHGDIGEASHLLGLTWSIN
jgi:hypothetical protein